MPRLEKAAVEGKERQLRFWDAHHEGMRLWKHARDAGAAAARFRQALAYDPLHEDARYYLASALAASGDARGALEELAVLARQNPMSQRAFSRSAFLRAAEAKTRGGMLEALRDAERAHGINPEETGALLLLGEIELLLGRGDPARRHLERVVLSNPRSEAAHFGLAWLAQQRGDGQAVQKHLAAVKAARGPEWKPKQSTSEGDTARRFHEEGSLVKAEADTWDGTAPPPAAFAGLERRRAELR